MCENQEMEDEREGYQEGGGWYKNPLRGLQGWGEGTGPSVMAPPYRGPGYVTRWLSATGDGMDTRRGGRELAIIAEVAALAGARTAGKDFWEFKDFRGFRELRERG